MKIPTLSMAAVTPGDRRHEEACLPTLRASAGIIAAPSMPLTLTAAWFAPIAVARS